MVKRKKSGRVVAGGGGGGGGGTKDGPRHAHDAGNRDGGGKGGDASGRSASKVRLLNLYKRKAKRDSKGRVIKQEYQSKELPSTRIQPDRRWFGNTRVIDQAQLERFTSAMEEAKTDRFKVLLKARKLPVGLINSNTTANDAKEVGSKAIREALLSQQSFADTFGSKVKRKKPKVADGDLETMVATANASAAAWDGDVDATGRGAEAGVSPAAAAAAVVTAGAGTPSTRGFAGGRERERLAAEARLDGYKNVCKDGRFEKGQSKRIWGELYKVIDSSDVIVQVLDARDPYGTRSRFLEAHIARNCPHKHVILLLNKCDLVPGWVTKRYLYSLSREYPTLAFHASVTNPFGKGALMSLLRQLARLKTDKQAICAGFVGYPNVGKSSVINTLRTKKVCKVAPIPGETKVWQYITLTKKVLLIDCPGVVYQKGGDTDMDAVLKGVVRVGNLDHAEDFVPDVLRRVKREHLQRAYGISTWSSPTDFLDKLAMNSGKLLKGGETDVATAAKMLLYDWQRGRIPYFVPPPEIAGATTDAANVADDPALHKAAAEIEARFPSYEDGAQDGSDEGELNTNNKVGSAAAPDATDPQGVSPFAENNDDHDDDGEDSDGYGEDGLEWTEVLKNMK